MLYEMLTGQKPFDGDTPVAIALQHMQTPPKMPREINPSIPEGLEEITIKAMQKESSQRYQTSGEMINDIEEFKKDPSIVFEYKYFSTDGSTKYFDKVTPEQQNKAAGKRKVPLVEIDDDDEDEDDEDEDYNPRAIITTKVTHLRKPPFLFSSHTMQSFLRCYFKNKIKSI